MPCAMTESCGYGAAVPMHHYVCQRNLLNNKKDGENSGALLISWYLKIRSHIAAFNLRPA